MRMSVRTSTTAYHSVSGKRERLPYNGISDRRSCLTPCTPCSMLHVCSMLLAPCSCSCSLLLLAPARPAPRSSGPGDETELVVLL